MCSTSHGRHNENKTEDNEYFELRLSNTLLLGPQPRRLLVRFQIFSVSYDDCRGSVGMRRIRTRLWTRLQADRDARSSMFRKRQKRKNKMDKTNYEHKENKRVKITTRKAELNCRQRDNPQPKTNAFKLYSIAVLVSCTQPLQMREGNKIFI